jgi:HD superfamily phosphodiesterase
MNLNNLVSGSETKYRKKPELFFTRKWGDTMLWSHNLDHHRRVWHYAKELLAASEVTSAGKNESSETNEFAGPGKIDTDKLIMACYLHDLGMSASSGSLKFIWQGELINQSLVQK